MLRWKEFGTIGIDPNTSFIGLCFTPAATNNLQIGGNFKITMAAKDKSTSFDFAGVYTTVKEHEIQRSGWQTILENFKKYIEASNITQ